MSIKPEVITQYAKEIVASYESQGGINHIEGCVLPSQITVKEIINLLLDIFFPGFFTSEEIHQDCVLTYTEKKLKNLYDVLNNEIFKSLALCHETKKIPSEKRIKAQHEKAKQLTEKFFAKITTVRNLLKTDVDAFYHSDPAAKSHEEVIVSYPGIYAIAVFRAAHELHLLNVLLIPRIMTEIAHSNTGIDIHPGATIDEYFFIDHGTGVVIGETTTIGKNCRIYQGVTLGAMKIEFTRDEEGNVIECKKRHPTLEDDVTIYSGATILGGRTILKKGTVIGGNAWVTSTTEAGDKIIYDIGNTQKVLKK